MIQWRPKRIQNLAFFGRSLGSLLVLYLLSGCTLYSGNTTAAQSFTNTCSISSDQSGTVSGHWRIDPIPIAFHSGDFSATETAAIVAAATSWNNFFTASKGGKIFDFGNDPANPRTVSTPNTSQGGAFCAQGILQGNQFSGNVVIYKQGTWPSNYPSTAMALTSFCTSPSTTFPSMFMAIMEINFQGFFVQGTKLPDLQSITLHEFGHLLGLNHSCEAAQKNGTPLCSDPNINPDYLTASMFPVFTFDQNGNGQVKQTLGINDQYRANCLY